MNAIMVTEASEYPLIADTRTDITRALDYFTEVWNEGDLAAIRGYYHPDFVLVTDNGPIPLGQRLDDLESITKAGEDRWKSNIRNL